MMKRIVWAVAAVVLMSLFSACGVTIRNVYEPLPVSKSMLYTVDFKDMKLTPSDYEVLNMVEADSRITIVKRYENGILQSTTIEDPDGQFSIAEYKKHYRTLTGGFDYVVTENTGVLRAGFLSGWGDVDEGNPSDISVKLASYRLIQLVREQGGDYVIQPIYTTNVEAKTVEVGKSTTTTKTYRTIVSGKAIRLKTTGR